MDNAGILINLKFPIPDRMQGVRSDLKQMTLLEFMLFKHPIYLHGKIER
jgi:hypothetical protein